jgi:hypothetical protein
MVSINRDGFTLLSSSESASSDRPALKYKYKYDPAPAPSKRPGSDPA